MKHMILAVVFLLVFCGFASSAFSEITWERVPGIKESDIRNIVYSENKLYAATAKKVYRTTDYGSSWDMVCSVGADNYINFVGVTGKDLFICTEKGLFKSNDNVAWQEAFRGMDKEKNTLHIAFLSKKIYLGTEKGLFISSDHGATWTKDFNEAGSLSVKWIDFLDNKAFIVSEKGLYRESGNGWERVFVALSPGLLEAEEAIDDSQDIESEKQVNSLLIKDNKVFIATDIGAFYSIDKGKAWTRLPLSGLISQKINNLLYKEGNILAITDKGVFILRADKADWQPLYKGMTGESVASIAMDKAGFIWVATNKGLFKSLTKEDSGVLDSENKLVANLFKNEPSIREVQKHAIDYAEVHPDKIKNWRRDAGVRAMFPELSLDYDKTITYDSGNDRYYTGPYDWSMSVKWDLGDIIWNPDQTSIDTRSRLMVQLRDDIIDEVNRIYFERRRLQLKNRFSPSVDENEKMDRDLRIDELTADLDALTGGYFSGELE